MKYIDINRIGFEQLLFLSVSQFKTRLLINKFYKMNNNNNNRLNKINDLLNLVSHVKGFTIDHINNIIFICSLAFFKDKNKLNKDKTKLNKDIIYSSKLVIDNINLETIQLSPRHRACRGKI